MTRRIFPNGEDRLIYGYTSAGEALISKAGATVTIYTDSACTTLADIQTEAGAAISGSVLTVDSESRIPRFKGPDGTPNGVDTLYALVQGKVAPGEPIYARYDDRLDVDTYIRCTSSTRPSSPTDDMLIYETDTNKFLRYDTASSQWLSVKRKYPDLSAAGGAAVGPISNVETTLITSATLAADGVTAFDIMGGFGGATATVATDVFEFRLYEDGLSIATLTRYTGSTATGAVGGGMLRAVGRTPASGNRVYTLKAIRLSGTGSITTLGNINLTVKEAQ